MDSKKIKKFVLVRRTSNSATWTYGLNMNDVIDRIQLNDMLLVVAKNTSRCTMVEYATVTKRFDGDYKNLLTRLEMEFA